MKKIFSFIGISVPLFSMHQDPRAFVENVLCQPDPTATPSVEVLSTQANIATPSTIATATHLHKLPKYPYYIDEFGMKVYCCTYPGCFKTFATSGALYSHQTKKNHPRYEATILGERCRLSKAKTHQ